MTFHEFVATREETDDVAAFLPQLGLDFYNGPQPAFVYCRDSGSGYVIEKVADHWPEEAKAKGKFFLVIGNCDWISNDLDDLERKLYDFVRSDFA